MFEIAQRNAGEPVLWKTERRRRRTDDSRSEWGHLASTPEGWGPTPVASTRQGSADILICRTAGFSTCRRWNVRRALNPGAACRQDFGDTAGPEKASAQAGKPATAQATSLPALPAGMAQPSAVELFSRNAQIRPQRATAPPVIRLDPRTSDQIRPKIFALYERGSPHPRSLMRTLQRVPQPFASLLPASRSALRPRVFLSASIDPRWIEPNQAQSSRIKPDQACPDAHHEVPSKVRSGLQRHALRCSVSRLQAAERRTESCWNVRARGQRRALRAVTVSGEDGLGGLAPA